MSREETFRNIAIAIVVAIALAMGIMSGNYIISAMYIATVIGAVFIVKYKDAYNVLYAILFVSVIYDYTLYVPGIQQVYMFHIILGIFTLLSLYKVFKDKDILFKLDRKILSIYFIWFIYMCASITWALSKRLAIKYIAIYLMMFAFIVCMMIYNINKERFNQTIKLLLYLISIVVVIGLIEVLLGNQLPVRHYIDGFLDSLPQWQINTIHARPIVFSYNTNNLTATLAILMPLCFFAIYKFENIFAKIWFTFISCVSFALVIITTSRTGFVAFILGFLVFLIYSIFNIKELGIKQMIFPIILIGGFILAYLYSPLLMNIEPVPGETMENSTSLSGKLHSLGGITAGEITEEGSALDRMVIIEDVINGVIKEKHYIGFGVGNVEQYIKDQGNSGSIYSPHCYAIEILGDFGLPGIALYGVYYLYLLIGNLIVGIKKKNMTGFIVVAGLIAFAPASFGPSSITYVFSYWILMGLAISNIQVNKNGKSSSIKEFTFI